MIDMCYVGSDMKYHSLSHWSIICHDATGRIFNQSISCQTIKKNKGLLESLSTPWVYKNFVSKMTFFPFLDIDLQQSPVTSRELKIPV